MTARHDIRSGPVHVWALLAAALLCANAAPAVCASAGPAAAQVRVVDTGDGNLVIEAHDATVRQVLQAVSASQAIQLRGTEALSRVVTGTFSGPLPQVLSRILAGYDHVIQSTAAGIRLEVFDTSSATRTTAAATATAAPAVGVTPNAAHQVSSNVDRDEEAAQTGAVGARTATPPVPAAPMPSIAPVPAVLTESAPHKGGPRISSNVDLDEEMSR
jgi:hypothetical protein